MKARIVTEPVTVNSRKELEKYIANCKERERCDADAEAYIAEKVRERDEFEKEMRRQEKAAGRRACIPPRGMAGMKYD